MAADEWKLPHSFELVTLESNWFVFGFSIDFHRFALGFGFSLPHSMTMKTAFFSAFSMWMNKNEQEISETHSKSCYFIKKSSSERKKNGAFFRLFLESGRIFVGRCPAEWNGKNGFCFQRNADDGSINLHSSDCLFFCVMCHKCRHYVSIEMTRWRFFFWTHTFFALENNCFWLGLANSGREFSMADI